MQCLFFFGAMQYIFFSTITSKDTSEKTVIPFLQKNSYIGLKESKQLITRGVFNTIQIKARRIPTIHDPAG